VSFGFLQITIENSPEVVANGHIVADTVRQRDVETNVSQNGTSTVLTSEKNRENDNVNGQQEVIPFVTGDMTEADTVCQSEEITMATSGLLIYDNKTENGDVNVNNQVVNQRDMSHQGVIHQDMSHQGVIHQDMKNPGVSHLDVNHLGVSHQDMNHPSVSYLDVNQDVSQQDVNHRDVNHPFVSHRDVNHRDINYQGLSHQDVNHQGVSHRDVNHPDINHPGVSRQAVNHRNMNHREVIPVVIEDEAELDSVRQNEEMSTETRRRGPPTKKRERETQILSLHIDDEADDEDFIAEEKTLSAENMSEGHVSGAEVFALNRPYTWRRGLAKKRHETVDEPALDRQVCLQCVFVENQTCGQFLPRCM